MKRKIFTEALRVTHKLATQPELFIVAGIAYLIITSLATMDPLMQAASAKISTTPLTVCVFMFGLLAFYIGLRTSNQARKLSFIPFIPAFVMGVATAYYIIGLSVLLSILMSAFVLMVCAIVTLSRFRWEYMFATGAFALWVSYAVNGLPLIDISLHNDLLTHVNPMFITGFFLMTYSLARLFPAKRYLWPFLLFSLALSTFRLYACIAFIAWLLLELNAGMLKRRDIGRAAVLAAVAAALFVLFISVGYSVMSDNNEWSLDPIRTFEHRLAFTMSVFDNIVHLSFPWGYTYGGSITMESTEYTCAVFYGYDCRITSTAFGEAMMNFGLPAVFIVGWWSGIVLGNLRRKDYPLYAVLMAVLLGTLDVGINVFIIIGFTYMGWLRVIKDADRRTV